jgi:hypothetical protein
MLTQPRREKQFGHANATPLIPREKYLLLQRANCLVRSRDPKTDAAWISRADLHVLRALLFRFHNCRTGLCFPSYDAIAAAAKVCRATVGAAIRRLEACGLLTWRHRLARRLKTEWSDLLSTFVTRHQIIRSSNAYAFTKTDTPPTRQKANEQHRTNNQPSVLHKNAQPPRDTTALTPTLDRWRSLFDLSKKLHPG